MRDIALTLFIPLSMIWGLMTVERGLIVLNWICFMRPYEFSWGIWTTVPTFKVALAVSVLSALIHQQIKPKLSPFLLFYLGFLAWLTLAAAFAYNTTISWQYYKDFILTNWFVAIFIFSAVNKLETLKWCLWVSAGSLAVIAAKVGLVLGAKGGAHLTGQITGFVGDNNVFGLTLCLALAVVFGLRSTIPKKFRPVFYGIWTAALTCILFTKSRGAFLTTAVIMLLSSGTSRHPVRNVLILLALSFAAYTAAPKEFFDRLDTLENIEEDGSAQSRLFFWRLSYLQALERPIFGVGLDNHTTYNEAFYATELGDKTNHVAHSVYFQLLAESGFVGLGLYLIIILWTAWALARAYSRYKGIGKSHPDLAWVAATAFWMRNGFIGYMFGSAFLNMLVFDFPWYFIWYAHMLQPLVDQELSRRARADAKARAAAPAKAADAIGPAGATLDKAPP